MLCNAISFTLTLPGNGYGYEYKMCELIKTILISESLESKWVFVFVYKKLKSICNYTNKICYNIKYLLVIKIN